MTGGDESWFDNRIHRRTFFLPLGYTIGEKLYPQVVAYVMGDDILCGYRVKGKELSLYTASGKSMKESVIENLEGLDKEKNKFMFISSCAARLETLGEKTYLIKEEIEKKVGALPYVLLFTGGEQTYEPGDDSNFYYESFNSLVLSS